MRKNIFSLVFVMLLFVMMFAGVGKTYAASSATVTVTVQITPPEHMTPVNMHQITDNNDYMFIAKLISLNVPTSSSFNGTVYT